MGTIVSAGGDIVVSMGGVASAAVISAGGAENVLGSDTRATVLLGGLITVSAGGSESGSTVGASGTLDVLSGGSTISSTVVGGGLVAVSAVLAQEILSGGTATAMTISSTASKSYLALEPTPVRQF